MQPFFVQHGQQLLLMPLFIGPDLGSLGNLNGQPVIAALSGFFSVFHVLYRKGKAENPGQQRIKQNLPALRAGLNAGIPLPALGMGGLLIGNAQQHSSVVFVPDACSNPAVDKRFRGLAPLQGRHQSTVFLRNFHLCSSLFQ